MGEPRIERENILQLRFHFLVIPALPANLLPSHGNRIFFGFEGLPKLFAISVSEASGESSLGRRVYQLVEEFLHFGAEIRDCS